jgi:hypothetical protein
LLLGSVLDVLREERVDADLAASTWEFAPESGFRFRFVDNWMRFRGQVKAPLRTELTEEARLRLEARFAAVWGEILAAVRTVPMPDPLDATRCEVAVTAGAELTLAFDFEAD